MKKNLLSIIILALLVINLILTSIMMFSVMSTNKKTGAVVSDIASILKLELGTEEEQEAAVSMEDTAFHDVEEEMTIMLAKDPTDEEAKDHFVLVQVSLSMDTKNKDYKTYGGSINDNQIAGVMQDVLGRYTADEVQPKAEDIKAEVLAEIQKLYNSEFIYKVTFSKLVVQ